MQVIMIRHTFANLKTRHVGIKILTVECRGVVTTLKIVKQVGGKRRLRVRVPLSTQIIIHALSSVSEGAQ